MFGLGKLVSGLTGGLLDKVGLGFLKPFVSGAVNFFSGNYAALIGDVLNIVAEFTNSSFLDNLAKLQPLGAFSDGNFSFDKLLLGDGLGFLKDSAQLLGMDKVNDMLSLVDEFSDSMSIITQQRQAANSSCFG